MVAWLSRNRGESKPERRYGYRFTDGTAYRKESFVHFNHVLSSLAFSRFDLTVSTCPAKQPKHGIKLKSHLITPHRA